MEYLAAHAGIRQFLDIGTGIPTANNTHEVAQAIAPEARVVYVDNDPMVLAHARALLNTTTLRSRPQIARFFEGLEMLDPGLVQVQRWRPGSAAPDDGEQIPGFAGLARKPA